MADILTVSVAAAATSTAISITASLIKLIRNKIALSPSTSQARPERATLDEFDSDESVRVELVPTS